MRVVVSTILTVQYNPDRTRCSGSTERMRVIGEARIKYPIFSGPTNFYVYGSIRYCLLYATVLLIFDPIKCVNTWRQFIRYRYLQSSVSISHRDPLNSMPNYATVGDKFSHLLQ